MSEFSSLFHENDEISWKGFSEGETGLRLSSLVGKRAVNAPTSSSEPKVLGFIAAWVIFAPRQIADHLYSTFGNLFVQLICNLPSFMKKSFINAASAQSPEGTTANNHRPLWCFLGCDGSFHTLEAEAALKAVLAAEEEQGFNEGWIAMDLSTVILARKKQLDKVSRAAGVDVLVNPPDEAMTDEAGPATRPNQVGTKEEGKALKP